jgi:hypothetical protein
MLYNIYSNIDDTDFRMLSDELDAMQEKIQTLLIQYGFAISREKKDGLVINAWKFEENCYSNIAITFDDLPNHVHSFSVGFIKSIDIDNRRFYRKDFVATSVSIDFVRSNLTPLVQKAIDCLERITKQELLLADFVDLKD